VETIWVTRCAIRNGDTENGQTAEKNFIISTAILTNATTWPMILNTARVWQSGEQYWPRNKQRLEPTDTQNRSRGVRRESLKSPVSMSSSFFSTRNPAEPVRPVLAANGTYFTAPSGRVKSKVSIIGLTARLTKARFQVLERPVFAPSNPRLSCFTLRLTLSKKGDGNR
jgi:hypothetical protein